MALITCPECNHEISDQAKMCPHCGFPLSFSSTSTPEETASTASTASLEDIPVAPDNSDSSASTAKRSKLPKIIAIATCAIVFVLIIISQTHITANNVKQHELYNKTLDVGLRLGTSKSSVDKKLGSPELSFGNYFYPDVYLYTQYVSGELASFYVEYPNDRWITKGGITIGSTTDEITEKFGKPASIEHDDRWWYYVSNNGITGFEINSFDNTVMAIYIYDPSKIN